MQTRPLLVVITLFLLAIVAAAQQRDVRISPEPVSYALPWDIRIESADRVGDITLVVWGSTRSAADSTVVNALYVQIVHGSTPLGEPRVVHGPDARPSGFVRVLALGNGFVVVWNDARVDAPGLYMQWVSIDGTNDGAEERYATGRLTTMALTEINRLDLDDGGMRLVWNDTRADSAGVYTLRIGSDGAIVDSTRRVGDGRIVRELRYDSLPGIRVLLREKHGALIAYSNGEVDSRSVPMSRFQLPFYLNADTSVAEIENGEIREYRSLFDSVAYRSIRINALDSAVGSTTVLTYDSSGRYEIVYAVTTQTGNAGILEEGWFTLGIYRLTVMSDDSVQQDSVLFIRDRRGYYSTSSVRYKSYTRGSVLAGCSNTLLVRHVITTMRQSGSYYPSYVLDTLWYTINNTGEIALKEGRNYASCTVPAQILPARKASDTMSTVQLIDGKDSVQLQHETAPVYLNDRQTVPGVILYNDTLLVGWTATGGFPGQYLFRWEPQHNTIEHIASSVTLLQLRGVTYFPHNPINSTSLRTDIQVLRSGQSLLFLSEQHRTDTYIQFNPGNAEYGWNDRYSCGVATSAGWMGQVLAESESYIDDMDLSMFRWSWNPEGNYYLVQFHTEVGSTDRRGVLRINADGSRGWSVDATNYLKDYHAIIPIDSNDFWSVSGTRADLFRKEKYLDSASLPQTPVIPGYVRLQGDHFLRYYTVDSLHLQFELFDLRCKLQYSRLLEFTSNPPDLFIVQRPSDSAVVLLWGSRNGVRATFLTSQLNIIAHDSAISATRDSVRNPSGAFRNDTLFCVWEDYRNGVSDIYGTGFLMTSLSAPGDEPENTGIHGSDGDNVTITRVLPNPAENAVAIEFVQYETGSSKIEVIDAVGRCVAASDYGVLNAGKYARVLDVAGLVPGIYTLVLHFGDTSDRQRLIVVH